MRNVFPAIFAFSQPTRRRGQVLRPEISAVTAEVFLLYTEREKIKYTEQSMNRAFFPEAAQLIHIFQKRR